MFVNTYKANKAFSSVEQKNYIVAKQMATKQLQLIAPEANVVWENSKKANAVDQDGTVITGTYAVLADHDVKIPVAGKEKVTTMKEETKKSTPVLTGKHPLNSASKKTSPAAGNKKAATPSKITKKAEPVPASGKINKKTESVPMTKSEKRKARKEAQANGTYVRGNVGRRPAETTAAPAAGNKKVATPSKVTKKAEPVEKEARVTKTVALAEILNSLPKKGNNLGEILEKVEDTGASCNPKSANMFLKFAVELGVIREKADKYFPAQ